MSFVGRLFSSSTTSPVSKPVIVTSSPSLPPQNGHIGNGHVTPFPNGTHVKVRQQQNGFSRDHLSRSAATPVTPKDGIIPRNGHLTSASSATATPATGTSWFRSIFSSSSQKPVSASSKSTTSSSARRKISFSRETPTTTLSRSSSFASINSDANFDFAPPASNAELVERLPLELTQHVNGAQLRLMRQIPLEIDDAPEPAVDVTDGAESIASLDQLSLESPPQELCNVLTQTGAFNMDNRRVGLLVLDKRGSCGYTTIRHSPLEKVMKSLLVENIIEEVPKPTRNSPNLLGPRKSPSGTGNAPLQPINVRTIELPGTTGLASEGRRRASDRSRSIDLDAIDIGVFYSTLAEMVFGSIQLVPRKSHSKPAASSPQPESSLIDHEFESGAKVVAFKLHHVGTIAAEQECELIQEPFAGGGTNSGQNDLYITTFIIDVEDDPEYRLKTKRLQYGIAILWLCPHHPESTSQPSATGLSSELTLSDLLFNTPDLLIYLLRGFTSDMLRSGMTQVLWCFSRMIHRLNEFINAVRLTNRLHEPDAIDALVELISAYDNRESSFFMSTFLTNIFTFAYKQDRFKLVLWSSQSSQLPMMVRLITLANQFLVKSVHDITDPIVINDDFFFVAPPELKNLNPECVDQSEEAMFQQQQLPPNYPVPGSSCSSTVSTITAIQVQASLSYPKISESNSLTQKMLRSKTDRKSRDESIGYESLTESAISGNVSPINGDEPDDASAYRQLDSLLQSQQSDAMRQLLNTSQTTDYEFDGSIARSDTNTTTSSNEDNTQSENSQKVVFRKESIATTASLNKRQSYFRGYVDLRYKDQLQDEESESNSAQPKMSPPSTSPNGRHCEVELLPGSYSASPKIHDLIQGDRLIQRLDSNNSDTSTEVAPDTPPVVPGPLQNQPESPDENIPFVALSHNSPFSLMKLCEAEQKRNLIMLNSNQSGNHSPEKVAPGGSASPMYNFGWLSYPVVTTHHLDLVHSQVILGSESNPNQFESIKSKILTRLKSERIDDTVLLVNCDTFSMDLLERAIAEPCAPLMSNIIASTCEKIHHLATVENRKHDIWRFLRFKLTQLLLKSEVLQSTLENDLHLVMASKQLPGGVSKEDGTESTVIEVKETTKVYSRKLWSELIGDPNVGCYLTCDGEKSRYELFHFRAATSHLYLFSDSNLSRHYASPLAIRNALDFEVSDIPVIVGMRKQFLLSKRPLIDEQQGRDASKQLAVLLDTPPKFVEERESRTPPELKAFLQFQKPIQNPKSGIGFGALVRGSCRRRSAPLVTTSLLTPIPEND